MIFKKLSERSRRRKQAELEAKAALAAKIEAGIERRAAWTTYGQVDKQSRRLQAINHRNHFSEGLTQAFRGKPL